MDTNRPVPPGRWRSRFNFGYRSGVGSLLLPFRFHDSVDRSVSPRLSRPEPERSWVGFIHPTLRSSARKMVRCPRFDRLGAVASGVDCTPLDEPLQPRLVLDHQAGNRSGRGCTEAAACCGVDGPPPPASCFRSPAAGLPPLVPVDI